ncbi:hypothetical protein KY329_00475 [Candidatus Woesearchaeota archaeon]|nr:hypothetical protein [Candidatus Woesearchaeota archaeon]
MVKVYSKHGQGSLDADLEENAVKGLLDHGFIFIDPRKITGYYCSVCRNIEGHPAVTVDVTKLHGQVLGAVCYRCKSGRVKCGVEKECGIVILRDLIPEENLREVPLEYIGEDPEFLLKTPQITDIFAAAENALGAARLGSDSATPLRIAKDLAERLGHALPERYEREVHEARDNYLYTNMAALIAGIPLPSTYDEIPEQAYELIRIATERGVPEDVETEFRELVSICSNLMDAEQIRQRDAADLLQQRSHKLGKFLDPWRTSKHS